MANATVAKALDGQYVERWKEGGPSYGPEPSAREVARKLVRGITRLYRSRGLIDLFRDDEAVMGRMLASALADLEKDEALVWAQRLDLWTKRALDELERKESG